MLGDSGVIHVALIGVKRAGGSSFRHDLVSFRMKSGGADNLLPNNSRCLVSESDRKTGGGVLTGSIAGSS